MEGLIFWLFGWVLLSIGYFYYNICTNNCTSKKVIAWRAFWTGIFSWIGIVIIFCLACVGGIFALNEWVEEKLSK